MQRKNKKININTILLGLILILVLASFFSGNSNLFKRAEAGKTDLIDMQFTFRKIAEEIMPQVVEIKVVEVKVQEMPENYSWPFNFMDPDNIEQEPFKYEQEGLGSGIIVKRNGDNYFVLTNNHVIGKADEIKVKLNDNTIEDAEIIGIDERKDIAIISFMSDKPLSVAKLGDSDKIAIGDIVLAVGSPLGYDSSVTAGIISALGRNGPEENINDFIQTDASMNQGNSGGALVNLDGEVIGVNTWIATNTGDSIGLGFSIPINNLKKTIEDVITSGTVKYGWLGVLIFDLDDEILKSLDTSEKEGVLITNTYKSSPAYKAGIEVGDIIIYADNEKIINSKQFIRTIGEIKEGDEIQLTLMRAGKKIETTTLIELRKDDIELSEISEYIWPGLIAFPLSKEILTELELDDNTKGLIISVLKGSMADNSGLKDYDIIKSINNNEIEDLKGFYQEINTKNKTIDMEIYRDEKTLKVELSK